MRKKNRVAIGLAMVAVGASFRGTLAAPAGVTMARDGKALLRIVQAADTTPAERYSVAELTNYLSRITGAAFAVIDESDAAADQPAIHVGSTAFARRNGIDAGALAPEESVVRTVGGSLVLVGGQPRGTLYAVYDFLETDLACRWYTAWAEKIPSTPTLSIPDLDRTTRPYFMYRDAYTYLTDPRMYADHDGWTKYLSRNRAYITPDRSALVEALGATPVYGGRVGGGHGFAPYLPSDRYFEDHPEYFSMRNGKRVPSNGLDGNHACLTHPDVLKIVIEGVKEDIRGNTNAMCYTVAVNDGGCKTICDCPECRRIARQYGATDRAGTDTGLLFWFVNRVADAVGTDFPDKYVRTLVYGPATALPKNIRCRDNVVIQLCGIASPEWSQVAKHVWMWQYACESRRGYYVRPLMFWVDDQLKLARDLGSISGLFLENEFLVGGDCLFYQFYELTLWAYFRLCQDPRADLKALVDDFLAGYYGPAAPPLRQYLDLLRTRRHLYPYRLFDFAFVSRGQALFDQAEAAARDSATHLARVKDTRLQLDLTALALRNTIVNDYLRQPGAKLEEYPFPRALLTQRLLSTVQATRHPLLLTRSPHYKMDEKSNTRVTFEPVQSNLLAAIRTFGAGPEFVPLPEPFRALPPGRVFDFTGAAFGLNPYAASATSRTFLKDDPEAADGVAYVLTGTNAAPLPVGVWNNSGVDDPDFERQQQEFLKQDQSGRYVDWPGICRTIRTNDVPARGYHLYRGPRFRLRSATQFYATKSWQFGQPLGSLFDPEKPGDEWDVYLSVKFTGPAYPHGRPDEHNAVYIDRLILVRAE